MCSMYNIYNYIKDSQKINQKATKLLLMFQLDALSLLWVTMTNMQENSQVFRLHTVNCYVRVTELGVASYYCKKSGDPTIRKICSCILIEALILRYQMDVRFF